VIRSGRVIEARVEQGSGIDLFDQACVASIQRSNPFPPLPANFADEIIGITIPFKYDPTMSRGN
jgi:TonB family protein